jgi:hypothetical protein
MTINYNPNDYETIVKHYTCDFHIRHPGNAIPGCGCHSTYIQRRKDKTIEEAEMELKLSRDMFDLSKYDE